MRGQAQQQTSVMGKDSQRKDIMRRQTFALVLLCLLTNPAMAQSQDSGTYEKFNAKWRVYVGGFFPSMSSKINISGDNTSPPPIDIGKKLGVEENNSVPWGGVQWHISQRNSLEFEFFELNRDGFIDLVPEPIEVADLIIESGSIDTAFDISISRLTYGFSIARSERMDLQIKGGLHIADLSVALQLSGAVCDVSLGEMPPGCPAGQTPPVESEEVTAPLPHFGVSWGYAITPNVSTNLQVIGFAIEIDGIDGSLVEVDADITWQPWQNFGFGAGLRYFNANVEGSGTNLNGEFDLEYYGPTVYIQATF